MPRVQQIHLPLVKNLIRRAIKYIICISVVLPTANKIFVASSHIKVSTSKITFILIDRLKNGACVARRYRITQFTTVKCGCGSSTDYAIRKITSYPIHFSVSWIDVKEVRNHWRSRLKPALRKAMLSIKAITFCAIITAGLSPRKNIRRRSRRNVRVHIPNLSVEFFVCSCTRICASSLISSIQ